MRSNYWMIGLTWAWMGGVIAVPSEAKIEVSGSAVVSAQDVDLDSTTGNADEDFNFNDPRVNLYFKGDISEKVSFNFTLWASNDWSHENIRGAAGNIALNDAAELRTAFVTLKDIRGSGITLKAGRIVIPYGYEGSNRTANGDFSKNDFVTNSLLDISGIDDGISLSGSFEGMSMKTPVSWEAVLINGGAVTDGSPSGAGGQNRSNDDLGWAARLSAGVADNLTVQFSWYTSDQSKDGDNDVLHIGSAFFVGAVEVGDHTQGVISGQNKNLVGLVYNDDANGGAYDRDLWEVSAKYDFEDGYVLGFWGTIDADTATAANSREWNYWGAQARYNVDDHAYVAARWNQLDPDYAASGALGEPTLLTIAAGYKLADNAQLKAEWKSFDEDGDGLSNLTTAVGAATSGDGRSADADALTIAIGVKF